MAYKTEAMAEIRHKKRKDVLKQINKYKHIYIILALPMLYYFVFCYLPMFGVVIAFQDYSVTKGVFGSEFVGLKYFKSFLSDYNFWRLLKNTLTINAYDLVFGFTTPIILALMLNELHLNKFKRFVQTATYLPHFISVVVMANMVLTFVSSEGMINSLLGFFGVEKIPFMTQPKYFYSIYTISGIWQNLGWNSIIYMAALSSIDMELYEAARIDGAGRWKQTLHVTLPGISSTIILLLIMRIGSLVSVGYEKIMLLYNPSIYETADVISTYVYRRGLLDRDYSYSAAVGIFNSIINMIFLWTANKMSNKITGSGLW